MTHTCTECGREFDTERGLNRHLNTHQTASTPQNERLSAAMHAVYPKGIPVDELDEAIKLRKVLGNALS